MLELPPYPHIPPLSRNGSELDCADGEIGAVAGSSPAFPTMTFDEHTALSIADFNVWRASNPIVWRSVEEAESVVVGLVGKLSGEGKTREEIRQAILSAGFYRSPLIEHKVENFSVDPSVLAFCGPCSSDASRYRSLGLLSKMRVRF